MITWHFLTGAAKGRLDLEGLSKVIAALCDINKIK
jgi:hypothetical protein